LYPSASRQLIGGRGDAPILAFYAKIGISGYGFHAGLPPLIPVFYYLSLKNSAKIRKYTLFSIMALVYIACFLSATTANILIATLALLLSVVGMSVYRKQFVMVLAMVAMLFFLFIGSSMVISSGLNVLIKLAPTEGVAMRLRDVDLALHEGIDVTGETTSNLTTLEGRFQRVFWNLDSWSRSPLWGTSDVPGAGAHLYWLFFLANFGIIGSVPYLFVLIHQFRKSYASLDVAAKYYYAVAMGTFFVMGLTKNVTSEFMFFVPFALVPIYFKSVNDASHIQTSAANQSLQ
jgi:hypothetical protein